MADGAPDASMDRSERSWSIGERLIEPRLSLHRRHQRPDADDIQDAREVIGEHVQRHLVPGIISRRNRV